jgi:serine protease Do
MKVRLRIVSAVAALALGLALLIPAQAAPDKSDRTPENNARLEKKALKELKVPAVFAKEAPAGVEDLKAIQAHIRKVLQRVAPAVVGVRIGPGSGSGVVVSAEGHVLTAGHVSGKPDQEALIIFPDGRKAKGKTLGANRGIDSGMIQITEKGKWPYVEMGDYAKVKAGNWCLALGHPRGVIPGRTPPVRLGRVLTVNKSWVRSDCTLVGGDSGGPLFDMSGKVIGIHSRIEGPITGNVHVPVDTYKDTWDRLVQGETWGSLFGLGGGRRPAPGAAYLGVQLEEGDDACTIVEVREDSPAEKAGLKVGDVLVSLDGKKITQLDEVSGMLGKKKVGDEVTVIVLRDKKETTLKVKLGKAPRNLR